MPVKVIILSLLLMCTSCKSSGQPFVVYKQGTVTPVIMADGELAALASDFALQFEAVTGTKPPIVGSASSQAPVIVLSLSKNTDGFSILQKGNKLLIEGKTANDVAAGIAWLFAEYAGRLVTDDLAAPVKEITLPKGMRYRQENAFSYREPFFPDNVDPAFRKWNNTQTLEEVWALWGHNIGKVIKVTPAMYATVDGELTKEQLCFSSTELEAALAGFVRNNAADGQRHKFMVMPDDNNMVCECARCRAMGNTKDNAGPAVFSLINRLAKQFPEQDFFSTAYATTEKAPDFSLERNAGIMISTMPFPKGVIIENSEARDKAGKIFSDWKKVTGKIYLWDYAVNFDNYFDAYPTLLIAQQNLKYYKKQGVSGIFMHGNEEGYSAFGDLKAYIYAQLLQDLDSDVKKHIKIFFDTKYPTVSSLLYDYYVGIEERTFQSVKPLDIYGGMSQSYKKYLDDAQLKAFYDALIDKTVSMGNEEKERLSPLLASLAFQQLEVMRTNAFEANGYADYNYDDGTAKMKPRVGDLLDALQKYAGGPKLTTYSELGFTVADYCTQWQKNIISPRYKSLFYGKAIRSSSGADEEYPDARMLNDGNIGLNDYFNNWYIADSISIGLKAPDVKGAKIIGIGFLEDVRHKIFLPEKVLVTIDGRNYEAVVPSTGEKGIHRVTISLPVEIRPEDKMIHIEVLKNKEHKNRSVACDEVYFK